ncbi:hypothetical protein D3C80_1215480 [compost metagenome]
MDHPAHDGQPLVVAAAHQRAQRLLGDQVRQDGVLLGVLGFLGAYRGQARGVGGIGLAAAREIGGIGGIELVEHHGLQVELVDAREIGEVLLGRGARLHADRRALELLGALHLGLGRHHEALAVIEHDGRESQAHGSVARQRHRRIARQHVHFAGLQGREALLRRQRHPFDFLRIAQQRGRDGLAHVHVQACPLALAVGRGEARHAAADAHGDLVALLDRVQRLARMGRSQPGQSQGQQGKTANFHGCTCQMSKPMARNRQPAD